MHLKLLSAKVAAILSGGGGWGWGVGGELMGTKQTQLLVDSSQSNGTVNEFAVGVLDFAFYLGALCSADMNCSLNKSWGMTQVWFGHQSLNLTFSHTWIPTHQTWNHICWLFFSCWGLIHAKMSEQTTKRMSLNQLSEIRKQQTSTQICLPSSKDSFVVSMHVGIVSTKLPIVYKQLNIHSKIWYMDVEPSCIFQNQVRHNFEVNAS